MASQRKRTSGQNNCKVASSASSTRSAPPRSAPAVEATGSTSQTAEQSSKREEKSSKRGNKVKITEALVQAVGVILAACVAAVGAILAARLANRPTTSTPTHSVREGGVVTTATASQPKSAEPVVPKPTPSVANVAHVNDRATPTQHPQENSTSNEGSHSRNVGARLNSGDGMKSRHKSETRILKLSNASKITYTVTIMCGDSPVKSKLIHGANRIELPPGDCQCVSVSTDEGGECDLAGGR